MDTMPLGFDTTDFDMEVDLLFANRELVFSWTRAVEKAGLKVLDIAVDLYAASKETGSLLQSADAPVILIDLEADHTSLALLSDNKMAFGAILDQGFRSFTASLEQAYSLSEATAWRLLENLFSSSEDKADDSIVYIEQQEGRRVELTARQLANAVLPIIRSWIAEINGASAPILSKTRARYLITGEGSAIRLPQTQQLLQPHQSQTGAGSDVCALFWRPDVRVLSVKKMLFFAGQTVQPSFFRHFLADWINGCCVIHIAWRQSRFCPVWSVPVWDPWRKALSPGHWSVHWFLSGTLSDRPELHHGRLGAAKAHPFLAAQERKTMRVQMMYSDLSGTSNRQRMPAVRFESFHS